MLRSPFQNVGMNNLRARLSVEPKTICSSSGYMSAIRSNVASFESPHWAVVRMLKPGALSV